MNGLNEKDKPEDKLRAIAENAPVKTLDAAWLIKNSGDSQTYNKLAGEGTVSYQVTVIKSLRWPGAVTVAKNGKYCSIYIGDSVKREGSFFFPTEPPSVLSDPTDQDEQPEPQGKEEEPKPEAPAEGEGGEAPADGGEAPAEGGE